MAARCKIAPGPRSPECRGLSSKCLRRFDAQLFCVLQQWLKYAGKQHETTGLRLTLARQAIFARQTDALDAFARRIVMAGVDQPVGLARECLTAAKSIGVKNL